VKWFLLAVVVLLVLGPGFFAVKRGADGSRPWLGRTAAIVVAALWVVAGVVIVRAL
jgi:hypothetical protein